MRSTSLLAFACALSEALAVYQGFNYGSTQTDGTVKTQQVFEDEFNAAKKLVGTNSGFTSARLYTMIQGGTTSDIISAIPAAIATKTSLLLGLWASGGDAAFANEITALKAAAEQYGSQLDGLIAGISVGSEDLYRDTYTYISSVTNPDQGASPDTIASYIKQVRTAIEGTAFSSAQIGHVDTWNAWTNTTVTTVIDNVDWLGVDEYPFFQNTMDNGIENAKTLFYNAYDAVEAISGGKDVWITEAGWPVSGDAENKGVASLANAKTFWDEVGCPSFGSVNTWWYTLQDAYPTTPNPSFGVVGSTLSSTPLFDLSCSNVTSSSTTSKSTNTASIVSSARSAASSAGGLTPTQSAGHGIGAGSSGSVTASATSIAAGATGSSGLATSVVGGSGSNGTGVAATMTPTSSGTAMATGAASAVTGSLVGGVFGAFVALMAAL